MSGDARLDLSFPGAYYLARYVIPIPQGKTLTVGPGAVLRFESGAGVFVNGALAAKGSTFTSAKAQPAPGDWRGILVWSTSRGSTLDGCVVEYGGNPGDWFTPAANLAVMGGQAVQATGCTFSLSAGYGLSCKGAPESRLSGNTFRDNKSAAILLYSAQDSPGMEGSSATGNAWNGVLLQNAVTDSTATGNLYADLPYLPGYLDAGGLRPNGLYLPSGATLRMLPGSILKMGGAGQWGENASTIEGDLIAEGTPDRPVTLTSWHDDSLGGDSDGDGGATAPVPGDWSFVELRSSGSRLSFVRVRYGGNRDTRKNATEQGALSVYHASPALANCVIEDSVSSGIDYFEGCGGQMHGCLVRRCADAGVLIRNGSSPLVANNTLVANGGAGVALTDAQATLSNNVLAFNALGVTSNTTPPTLKANCVFGNTGGDYQPAVQLSTEVNQDPLLVNRDAGDYHLLADSPCVGAGDPSTVDPAWTDLDGRLLLQGGTVDIGALGYAGVQVLSVRSVSPSKASNAGTATLRVQGSKFEAGMTARLVSASGASVPALRLQLSSAAEVSVTFDLRRATAGTYDLEVHTLEGGSAALKSAFQVTAGSAGRSTAHLVVPEAVRFHREYVLWLEYGNDGGADLAPSLFTVSSPDGALLRLSPKDGYSQDAIRILGVSQEGDPAALRPGSHYRIPIYCFMPKVAELGFVLDQTDGGEDTLDWARSLKQLRPQGVPADGWAAVTPALGSRLGGTTTKLLATITADATALARHNLLVWDVSQLLALEVASATGAVGPTRILASSLDADTEAPGLDVSLTRLASSTVTERYREGIFGRGWSHSFDVALLTPVGDTAYVVGPCGSVRGFTLDPVKGTWRGRAGDHAVLIGLDSGGYLLREKDGSSRLFHPSGRLSAVRDAAGNRLDLTYTDGLLTKVAHANGAQLVLEYNGQGRVSRLTDAAGEVTTYRYDDSGQHLLEVASTRGSILYTYAPSGHALTGITRPDGTHAAFAYDDEGRLSETSRDGGANRVQVAYPEPGAAYLTDASGGVTKLWYSPSGRVLAVENALGTTLSARLDPDGNPVILTDALGRAWSLEFDEAGNPVAATSPAGSRTILAYSEDLNRLTRLHDARNNRTDYAVSSQGALTGVAYPDGSSEAFGRDAAGSAISYTSRAGKALKLSRDAAGRLTRKEYPDGRAVDYVYDARGLLTSAKDSLTGEVALQYDNRGYLSRVEYPGGLWLAFERDAMGKRTRRGSSDGTLVNYQYDAAGRLSQLSDGAGVVLVRYEYDAQSRVVREVRGNGTSVVTERDIVGRPTRITHAGAQGEVQARFEYVYDAAGRVTSLASLSGTTRYEYDVEGRLTGITLPDGRQTRVTYDASGNRVQLSEGGAATAYATNALDQVAQAGDLKLAYDADGNLASITGPTGVTAYGYDPEGRLASVTLPSGEVWRVTYDALGQRSTVERGGVITRLLYDPTIPNALAAELDAQGKPTARYVTGLGLLARQDAAGAFSYYGFDALGNTRLLTGTAGALERGYDYEPFGAQLLPGAGDTNPFRFGGRYGVTTDPGDLLGMGVRQYLPVLGRFATPDPIGVQGGTNLYAYCHNDPVNFADPLGTNDTLDSYFPTQDTGTLQHNNQVQQTPSVAKGAAHGGVGMTVLGGTMVVVGGVLMFTGVGSFAGGVLVVSGLGLAGLGTGVMMTASAGDQLNKGNPAGFETLMKGAGTVSSVSAITDPVGAGQQEIGQRLGDPSQMVLPTFPVDREKVIVVNSNDPNEKVGPVGLGDPQTQRYVLAGQTLTYRIYFENVKTATAPAQEVTITDVLDPHLDAESFRLGEYAFGERVENGLAGQPSGTTTVRVGKWNLELSGQRQGPTITWKLRTLDPETGDLPLDAKGGFLPPNDDNHRGEGHVSFTVRLRPDTPPGTRFTNQATVVFDQNAPIVTNAVFNTLAPAAPAAPAQLKAVAGADQVTLSWSPAEGAVSYNLYYGAGAGVTKATGALIGGVTSPYVQTGLSKGATYRYVVTAVGYGGESPESSEVLATPGATATGDLNGDGRVNVADAVMGLKVAVGLIPTTPELLSAGDLNSNGRLDVSDVVALLRRVAGLL